MEQTAIEFVADILEESFIVNETAEIGDILVPEGCLSFYKDGKCYHVSIMEIGPESE